MLFVALFALAAISSTAQTSLTVNLADPAPLEASLEAFPFSNADRQTRARELFAAAKCPDLVEVPLGKKPIPANIVCVWPGTSTQAILVGAHFDKEKLGEGKIDNASGTVLLSYLMMALHQIPRRHTFIYAAFAEEELGLLGSKALVKKGVPSRPEKELIASLSAMVNIDSVGAGQTAIALSNSDKALAGSAVQVAKALSIPLRLINVDQVGMSDGRSFQRKNLPVIEFHSLDQQTFPILHTPRDTMDSFSKTDYRDTYRLLSFFLARLDEGLDK